MQSDDIVRVAAVGDLHCRRDSIGKISAALDSVNEMADVLVLCGDLTDYGTSDEARVLAKELSGVKLPMLGVLGNHDFEAGQPDEVVKILSEAGVRLLDGDSCEVRGVGFAGIKGFGGGFGRSTLGFWGEPAVKHFVQETLNEALKLESALARLKTQHRVVVMHYAPVRATVVGEPDEIFPYLGCGRLEEPLHRYPVSLVVHGHAHKGSPEGRTIAGDIPVYNVAMPLLRACYPEEQPFRVLELRAA